MSYDAGYKKIKNYKEVVWSPVPEGWKPGDEGGLFPRQWYKDEDTGEYFRLSLATHMILIRFLNIGFNEITEKNIDDWYAREKILQGVFGAVYTEHDGTPIHITYEDLKRHIGMWTNSTLRTWPQFFKLVRSEAENCSRRERSKYEKAQEEAAAEAATK